MSSYSATNLLEKQGSKISESYAKSLETSYRIGANSGDFIGSLLHIEWQTTVLLSRLNSSLNSLKSYNLGLQIFQNSTFDIDMKSLQNRLTSYVTDYNWIAKGMRHKAVYHLSKAVNCLQDLQFELYEVSMPLATSDDLLWYVNGLSSLINDCTVNYRLALLYIDKSNTVMSNSGPSLQYTMFLYPSSDTNYTECNNFQSNAIQILTNLNPVLVTASRVVSRWLQAETDNITAYGPRDLFQIANNPPIDIGTWSPIFNQLSRIDVERISNCFLAYEHSLNNATQAITQIIADVPQLTQTDALIRAQKGLEIENVKLDAVIRSYLTGFTNGRDSCVQADSILTNMASQTSTIKNEVSASINSWLPAVANWLQSLRANYLSALNTILYLREYLSDVSDLYNELSWLRVWLNWKISILPGVSVEPTSKNVNAIQRNILSMLKISNHYDEKVITRMFDSNHQSISEQSGHLIADVVSMQGSWLDERNKFLASYEVFNNSLQINENFIRYTNYQQQ